MEGIMITWLIIIIILMRTKNRTVGGGGRGGGVGGWLLLHPADGLWCQKNERLQKRNGVGGGRAKKSDGIV